MSGPAELTTNRSYCSRVPSDRSAPAAAIPRYGSTPVRYKRPNCPARKSESAHYLTELLPSPPAHYQPELLPAGPRSIVRDPFGGLYIRVPSARCKRSVDPTPLPVPNFLQCRVPSSSLPTGVIARGSRQTVRGLGGDRSVPSFHPHLYPSVLIS